VRPCLWAWRRGADGCRRIDGAPNFRRVPLTFSLSAAGQYEPDFDGKMVVGSGMPTVNGYVWRVFVRSVSLILQQASSCSRAGRCGTGRHELR
jgi:hypothetical protein